MSEELTVVAKPLVVLPVGLSREQVDDIASLNPEVSLGLMPSGAQPFAGTPLAVMLPASVTKEQLAEFKRLNPGTPTTQIMPGTDVVLQSQVVVAPSSDAANLWVDILAGLLGAGATALIPGPWAPWVAGVLKAGVSSVKAALTKAPYIERWPLETIQQQVLLIEDPAT